MRRSTARFAGLVAGSVLACFTLTTGEPLAAQGLSLAYKLDHFGYRPGDAKRVVTTADPGASVEILNHANVVVYRIPADGGSITALGFDGVNSGDSVWRIEFDGFTAAGRYHLNSASLGESYVFVVSDDVYDDPVRVAAKAFYYQRCGTAKTSAFAGPWSDSAVCHSNDAAMGPAAGQVDRGPLDLLGGWHDAGDYNKYAWRAVSDAVGAMLTAFEDNPTSFPDGLLVLPESGNGLPDLLDEIRWELDWLLKMQLPDGSVLAQMREPNFEASAPPSADSVTRQYYDPTAEAAAVLTGTTAHAARVFAYHGQGAYAATLKAAALAGWGWLAAQPDNSEVKAWAAAELYRLDPTQTAARSYVESYTNWQTQFYEIDAPLWRAAVAYLQSPGTNPAVASAMRGSLGDHVDRVFGWNDLYGAGMAPWQYYWGSNRPRALYGLFLLQAAKLGATGSHTAAECRAHALDFLHYLHGRNTLNMLYLSNMSGLGGEHSSYQIYHAWFGNSEDNYSAIRHLGRLLSFSEPFYPYFGGVDNHGVSDDKVSNLGPAPGFVPGGPNASYGNQGGASTPPLGAVYKDRFYRDWADQAVWTARTWEITEPSISYQGAYVALGTYFVTGAPPTEIFRDGFETGTTAAWSLVVP